MNYDWTEYTLEELMQMHNWHYQMLSFQMRAEYKKQSDLRQEIYERVFKLEPTEENRAMWAKYNPAIV